MEKYTALSVLANKHKIPNIELRGKKHGYSLDHIYSKKQGFIDNVDPEIIGHWSNLRIILESENNSKQAKCDITLEQLLYNYDKETRK